MTIVAGIDEAGFGPVLGPLVVSMAAFEVPEGSEGASMWRLLSGAVSRRIDKRRSVIAIADSKKLYSGLRGKAGLEHLERGVLSMLAAAGDRPASLPALLKQIAPASLTRLGLYPWYAGADVPLPASISGTGVALCGNAVAQRMARAGVRLLSVRSECVFAGEYNRMVEGTRNKSVTLLDVSCRLLAELWRTAPPGRLKVFVDRQGGRIRYLPHLQRVFEGCGFKVVEESDDLSAYEIAGDGRFMELCYAVECENRQLPVALASMVSKYVRELFMGLLNRFWADRLPGLAPTGGYYKDGRRFYGEIASAVRRFGYDESLLYRSR